MPIFIGIRGFPEARIRRPVGVNGANINDLGLFS